MSTKFEAAARALRLYRRFGSRVWVEPDHPKHIEFWNQLGDEDRAFARQELRAGLEAIREPDEAMVKAMHESDFASFSQEENGGCDSLEPEKAWLAAIDVLLAKARGGK